MAKIAKKPATFVTRGITAVGRCVAVQRRGQPQRRSRKGPVEADSGPSMFRQGQTAQLDGRRLMICARRGAAGPRPTSGGACSP